MTTAQEFRIGNYVYAGENDYLLQFNSFFGLCNLETSPENYRPIPLTEEWLLKFGFKPKYNTGPEYWDMYVLDLGENDTGRLIIEAYPYEEDNNDYWSLAITCPRNIEDELDCSFWINYPEDYNYVHQLQNLYFALTGEELQIIQP